MGRNDNEYESLNKRLNEIKNKINTYPKGCLRYRVMHGKEYCYLQFREGGHIRSLYLKRDEIEKTCAAIETRKELEKQAKELEKRLSLYAQLIGKHKKYRPVRNVDYEQYTLFMSTVAHDHKNMQRDAFLEKYDESKFRGLNKRYLAGYLDHINGIDRGYRRKTNDLVLDPYTYLMYFKYDKKEVLEEELERAIPAFLNRGLLITDVQEAVSGTFSQ
jgi:hypothetical protein